MLSVGWACAWAVCAPVWVVLWGGGGGVYLPQTGCAQVRCLALGAGHSGWTVKESETMLRGERSPGRGGCVPSWRRCRRHHCTQFLAGRQQHTPPHATHLAAHAGDTPTHRQAGGSTPTVGGTGVSPCRRLLPRRGVPCATPGTHPLLQPP